jgi:L-lactate dehydrogenase complex protein LldG
MFATAVPSPAFGSFKARAEAVSAEVHHFFSRTEALAFILQFLRNEGVADDPGHYAVWADCPFLDGLPKSELSASVPGLSFSATRERCAVAKVGISQVDWGKADTGTLVEDATAVEKRLVSTLPIIHIALLAAGNIVADLPALLTRIDPRQAGYIAFITGPSRTADIERVLTIGVHGPERLIIVVVDELSAHGTGGAQ